jgi:hypothetical protein
MVHHEMGQEFFLSHSSFGALDLRLAPNALQFACLDCHFGTLVRFGVFLAKPD